MSSADGAWCSRFAVCMVSLDMYSARLVSLTSTMAGGLASRRLLVDTEPVASTAVLEAVARAQHVALTRVDGHRAIVE